MGSICYTAFKKKSHAQAAHEYLARQGHWCLPIEPMEDGEYFFGFVIREPELPAALQHVLEECCTIDIELHPLNERHAYQNYCHRLYYNDYEAVDNALGYLIEGNIDRRAMAFEEGGKSAYTWRVVFCTSDEIGQEQRDLMMASLVPAAVMWNEPITGNTSPTSIFK